MPKSLLVLAALAAALPARAEPTDLCLDEPPAWVAALRQGTRSGREETGEIWRGGYGSARADALAHLLLALADRRLPGEAAPEPAPKGKKFRGTSRTTTLRHSLLAKTGEVAVAIEARVEELEESLPKNGGEHRRTTLTVATRYGEAKKAVELKVVHDITPAGTRRDTAVTEGAGASLSELSAVLATRLPNRVEEWPGCGEVAIRMLFRGAKRADDEP